MNVSVFSSYTCICIHGHPLGIGRATAKALAGYGAEVIAFSRTQADLDSLKQEVHGYYRTISWLVARYARPLAVDQSDGTS